MAALTPLPKTSSTAAIFQPKLLTGIPIAIATEINSFLTPDEGVGKEARTSKAVARIFCTPQSWYQVAKGFQIPNTNSQGNNKALVLKEMDKENVEIILQYFPEMVRKDEQAKTTYTRICKWLVEVNDRPSNTVETKFTNLLETLLKNIASNALLTSPSAAASADEANVKSAGGRKFTIKPQINAALTLIRTGSALSRLKPSAGAPNQVDFIRVGSPLRIATQIYIEAAKSNFNIFMDFLTAQSAVKLTEHTQSQITARIRAGVDYDSSRHTPKFLENLAHENRRGNETVFNQKTNKELQPFYLQTLQSFGFVATEELLVAALQFNYTKRIVESCSDEEYMNLIYIMCTLIQTLPSQKNVDIKTGKEIQKQEDEANKTLTAAFAKTSWSSVSKLHLERFIGEYKEYKAKYKPFLSDHVSIGRAGADDPSGLIAEVSQSHKDLHNGGISICRGFAVVSLNFR